MRYAVVAFALLAIACDSREDPRTDSAGGEVAGVEGTFVVGLAEWRITNPMDTLPPGRYTFRVENTGARTHGLEIEGNGKEWETGDIAPGSASELTVQLEPGTYEMYCPVESGDADHEERGMKRLLVVMP